MSDNQSELAFGFVNQKTITFPELPLKYGTIIFETITFDYTVGKFVTVQSHSLSKVTRKGSPRMFENGSFLAYVKESDIGLRTFLDWDLINLR